jgi:hypothetical protein
MGLCHLARTGRAQCRSPLVIPELMTLATLADVRKLLDHLPADHREKATWRYVADRLDEAARGLPLVDVTLPLRMVLRWGALLVGRNSDDRCRLLPAEHAALLRRLWGFKNLDFRMPAVRATENATIKSGLVGIDLR